MGSRVPLPYPPIVLELFRNPKHHGSIPDADVVARAGSPACGDMITIYLKVERRGEECFIADAKFESYGCAANIATASMLIDLILGKSIKEAWSIDWRSISDALGGLPPIKYHCSILAVGALRRAIRIFFKKIGTRPDWLPEEPTNVEKLVMEEERLAELTRKRVFWGGSIGDRSNEEG